MKRMICRRRQVLALAALAILAGCASGPEKAPLPSGKKVPVNRAEGGRK